MLLSLIEFAIKLFLFGFGATLPPFDQYLCTLFVNG